MLAAIRFLGLTGYKGNGSQIRLCASKALVPSTPDDLDYELLRILQQDARTSYRDIAKRLKVAEGTIYNRIKALEEAKILRGWHIDVAYNKLGYVMTGVLGIRIKGGHLGEIETKVATDPNCLAVYDVTGEFDAVVIAKFRTREELNAFVKRVNSLPHVERTYTMLALDVIKEEPGIMVTKPPVDEARGK